MRRTLNGSVKFIVGFYLMTLICTITWEHFVDGNLYSCSDGVAGYPIPVDLICLRHDKWPLQFVAKVVPAGMNDPDVIKYGWTVTRLWYLWSAFFASSVGVGFAFAYLPSFSRPLFRTK